MAHATHPANDYETAANEQLIEAKFKLRDVQELCIKLKDKQAEVQLRSILRQIDVIGRVEDNR
jgi:hypothetical protein